MSVNAKEQFTRLPWRILGSLRDGELSRDECLTLIYLVDEIAHLWRTPRKAFVTELAVIAFPEGQATLLETGPGVSVEDVIAATEAVLIIPDTVPEMRL